MMPPRVVLDTNVLSSALLFHARPRVRVLPSLPSLAALTESEF